MTCDQPCSLDVLLQTSTIEELADRVPFNGSQLRKAQRHHPNAPIFSLLAQAPGATLLEQAWRLTHPDPGCRTCRSPTTFLGASKGYSLYCGNRCRGQDAAAQRDLVVKRRQTMLDRYGATATLSSPTLSTKVKATMLERHGTTSGGQAGAAKRAATNQQRYGGPAPASSPAVARKAGQSRRQAALQHHLQEAVSLGFTLTGAWTSFDDEATWACPKGHTFQHRWSTAQRPPVCRTCTPLVKGTSQPERDLQDWLVAEGHQVRRNHRLRVDGVTMELDAYLPDLHAAVEFHGLFWHSEAAGTSPTYHLDRLDRCASAGIRLIQVLEHEWEQRRPAVHSVLRAKLGKVPRTLHARRLEVAELDATTRQLFFDATHLAGDARATRTFALRHNEEVVVAASFAPQRYGRDKTVMELIRFAAALDTRVVGGLSRLVTAAQRAMGFKVLRTFCDRRWSDGHGYLAAGFTRTGTTQPSYWYFTLRPTVVYHRSRFQRRRLEALLPGSTGTEWQLAQELGLNRIWDCGHLTFQRTFQ